MKDGDLTEDEAKKEHDILEKLEDEKKVAEGKISFKKPVKRDTSDKQDQDEPKRKKEKNDSKKSKQKSSLLSFDDEEYDE